MSVFKLRRESTPSDGGGGGGCGHTDFRSVRSGESSGQMLGPFSKDSGSCWFLWWVVNLPRGKASPSSVTVSSRCRRCLVLHTCLGRWHTSRPGAVESGSGLAGCVECLRCRAGVGCEGQPKPQRVLNKSDKIRLSFYKDPSGSSEGGDQGAPRMG